VVTKLSATLSPEDMREDVWLDWRPFQERGAEVFSTQGAKTYALNVATGLVAVWLAATWVALGRGRNLPRLWAGAFSTLALCLVVAAGVYLLLPKIEVRMVRWPFRQAYSNAQSAYFSLLHDNANATEILNKVSAAKQKGIAVIKNYNGEPMENPLLGGQMKEEDSPGNFTIRKTSEGYDFVCYDAIGGEHVMGPLQ
jgi:hypothetical protein